MSYSLCSRAQLVNLLAADRPLELFDYIQVMDTTHNLRHHSLSSVCFPRRENIDISTVEQFREFSRTQLIPLLAMLELDPYRLALVMIKWWQTAAALLLTPHEFQRNLTNRVYSVETVSVVDENNERIIIGAMTPYLALPAPLPSFLQPIDAIASRFRERLSKCVVRSRADNMTVPVAAMLSMVMAVQLMSRMGSI